MPGLSSYHVLHRKILCWSAPLLTVCFYICIFIKESFYFLLYILCNISTKSRNIHKYSCHLTTTNIRPIQLYVNYNREGTDRYFVRAFVVCIRVYVCLCVRQSVHSFLGVITETAVFISIKVLCRCQNV